LGLFVNAIGPARKRQMNFPQALLFQKPLNNAEIISVSKKCQECTAGQTQRRSGK
jgi:hypothetical protein